MNVIELIAACDFIMTASSHIYNGNLKDCQTLSDVFARDVVSCRNFAIKSGWLNSFISIVEATFDNNSQIVIVSSDDVPVFRYVKLTRGLPPDNYEFLDNGLDWQEDIYRLSLLAERGIL